MAAVQVWQAKEIDCASNSRECKSTCSCAASRAASSFDSVAFLAAAASRVLSRWASLLACRRASAASVDDAYAA
ncbi:g5254 [Coccomyxa elongata]